MRVATEQKREYLFKCAARVFREKGYHAASVQDVADAAGLQKGGLYYHIESKEALLFQIMDHGISSLVESLEAVCSQDLPPTKKLRLAMESNIVNVTEDPDSMIVTLKERQALSPQHLLTYIAKRDRYEGLFRQILKQGIEQGQFKPVDVKLTVFAILTMCNGVTDWYRPQGPLSPQEIASFFSQLILEGIKEETIELDRVLDRSGALGWETPEKGEQRGRLRDHDLAGSLG